MYSWFHGHSTGRPAAQAVLRGEEIGNASRSQISLAACVPDLFATQGRHGGPVEFLDLEFQPNLS